MGQNSIRLLFYDEGPTIVFLSTSPTPAVGALRWAGKERGALLPRSVARRRYTCNGHVVGKHMALLHAGVARTRVPRQLSCGAIAGDAALRWWAVRPRAPVAEKTAVFRPVAPDEYRIPLVREHHQPTRINVAQVSPRVVDEYLHVPGGAEDDRSSVRRGAVVEENIP